MNDTSGFYFTDGTELYFAPNFVETSTYLLTRDSLEDRERTDLPWRWFDTEAEARAFFNIPLPDPEEDPEW